MLFRSLDARFRLRPIETAYIVEETLVARNLDHAMDIFDSSAEWPYSVGWVDGHATGDGIGRGMIFRGRHATRDDLPRLARERPLAVHPRAYMDLPACTPPFARWPAMINVFNTAYRWQGRIRRRSRVIDYESFFFPLDVAGAWNRLYGHAGFVQHQSVFPKHASRSGLRQLLMAAAKAVLGQACTPDVTAATVARNTTLVGACASIISDAGLPAHTVQLGAKGCVTWTVEPVRNYRDYKTADADLAFAQWIHGINRGILLPPGLDEQWLISVMHTEEEALRYANVFEEFVDELTA